MTSNLTKASMSAILAVSLLGGTAVTATMATASPVSVAAASDTSAPVMDAFQAQILNLTNQHRANYGLAPLTWSNSIANVAQNWTNYQLANNEWKHNPDFAGQYPAGWTAAGENIAANEDAEAVFYSWVNSEGHNANLLNPAFTEMGVGYGLQTNQDFEYAGMYYVTQNLAGYPEDQVPVEEPPVEEPPVEEPPVEEPAPVDPPAEEPAPVDPPVEEPAPVDPPVEEPAPVDPPAEEPAPVDPPVEEPAPVDPPVEEPAPVDPPVEEPAPVDPPVEEPAPVDPPVETPVEEEPVTETPVEEEPVTEQPVEEAPADKPVNFTEENQGGLTFEKVADWTIVVGGLQANTAYDFVLNNGTSLGTLTTDANGKVTIDIADSTPNGVHHVAVFAAGAVAAGETQNEDLIGWVAFEVTTTEETVEVTNPDAPGAPTPVISIDETFTTGTTPTTDTNGDGTVNEDDLAQTAAADDTAKNGAFGALAAFLMATGLFVARGGKLSFAGRKK